MLGERQVSGVAQASRHRLCGSYQLSDQKPVRWRWAPGYDPVKYDPFILDGVVVPYWRISPVFWYQVRQCLPRSIGLWTWLADFCVCRLLCFS